MSVANEDAELRDLVMQVLENNGTLGKLKTQLRASVFLALDNNSSLKSTSANKDDSKVEALLKSSEGLDVLGLCRDLLSACNLTYTLCVFDSEVKHNLGGSSLPARNELLSRLGISHDFENIPSSAPLLSSVVAVQRIQSLAERYGVEAAKVLTARRCFSRYETMGCISYENLLSALAASFPSVDKKVLQNYCSDHYQDVGVKSEPNIDFEEFLTLYCYFLSVTNFSVEDIEDSKSSSSSKVKRSPIEVKSDKKIILKEKSEEEKSVASDNWEDGFDKDDDPLSLLPKITTKQSSRRARNDLFNLEKTLDSLNIDNDDEASKAKQPEKKTETVADHPDEISSFFNEKPPWETEKDYADDFNADEDQSPRRAALSHEDDCKVTDLSDEDEDVTMDEEAEQKNSEDVSANAQHSPTSTASDFTLNLEASSRSHYPHLASHPKLANVQFLEDVERIPSESSGSTKF